MKLFPFILLGILVSSSFGVTVVAFTTATFDGIIDVSTDKSEYEYGETVTVIITNIGEATVEIAGPCFNISNENGETVFSGCLFCLWELEPGESETWCWNQKDREGEQVPWGNYTVEGSFPVGDKKYSGDAHFSIKILSEIQIEILGGFGITIVVKNFGEEDLSEIVWSIELNGMIFIGKTSEGTIAILPAGSETIINSLVFGIGPGIIIVTVGDVSKIAELLIMGPFVIIH